MKNVSVTSNWSHVSAQSYFLVMCSIIWRDSLLSGPHDESQYVIRGGDIHLEGSPYRYVGSTMKFPPCVTRFHSNSHDRESGVLLDHVNGWCRARLLTSSFS